MLEKSFGWCGWWWKDFFTWAKTRPIPDLLDEGEACASFTGNRCFYLCRILMVQVYPNHLILQQGFLQRWKVLRLLHLHLRQLPPLPRFLRLLNLHLRQLKPVPKSQHRRGQQLTPLPKTHRNQVWKNLKSLSMMMGPIGRHLNLKDFKGTFLPQKKVHHDFRIQSYDNLWWATICNMFLVFGGSTLVTRSCPFHSTLRMRRFMTANEKNKVKATPEVIKLWGSNGGRFLTYVLKFFLPWVFCMCWGYGLLVLLKQ